MLPNKYSFKEDELFTGDTSIEYFNNSRNRSKPVNDVRSKILNVSKQIVSFNERIDSAHTLDELISLRQSMKLFKEDFDYSFTTDPADRNKNIVFEFTDGKNKVSIPRPGGMSEEEYERLCMLNLKKSILEGLASASSDLRPRVTARFPKAIRQTLAWGLNDGNIFKFIFMLYGLPLMPLLDIIHFVSYFRDLTAKREFNDSVEKMSEMIYDVNEEIKQIKRELNQSQQTELTTTQDQAKQESNQLDREADPDMSNFTENGEQNSSFAAPSEEETAMKRESLRNQSKNADTETAVSQSKLLESDIAFLKEEITKETALLLAAKLSFGLKDVTATEIELTAKTLLELVDKSKEQGPERTALLFAVKTQLTDMLAGLKAERLRYEIGALSAGKTQLISPKERAEAVLKEHEEVLKKAAGKEIPKLAAQNVNGNLYLGESQLVLLAHSAGKGFDMPVYMNEDQLKKAGLEARDEGVTLVSQKGNNLVSQKVYNIQETNFVEKYPEVYAKIAQSVKEKGNEHRQAMKSKPDVRVDAVSRLGVIAQTDRAATAAASLVAQAVSGQKAKSGGEKILDGTFQDVVRGLLESGGLSSSEFYALSSASQQAMVSCIVSGFSKEYGIDFNHEIESAVDSVKEEAGENELGPGEDEENESLDDAPGMDV